MKMIYNFSGVLLLILSVSCTYSKNQGDFNPNTIKLFVGYVNNYPVFDDKDNKVLYVVKKGPTLYMRYNPEYKVRCVYDKIVCFEKKTANSTFLIIKNGEDESSYEVNTPLTFIKCNNDIVVFSDLKDNGYIKMIKDGKIVTTHIEGDVIQINGNLVFFKRTHDPDLDYANADIFRITTTDFSDAEKLVTNVAGESTIIFLDGSKIYDEMLLDGEFSPIIYDLSEKKYSVLRLGDDYKNLYPFYSLQTKAIAFYNIKTLIIKEMP